MNSRYSKKENYDPNPLTFDMLMNTLQIKQSILPQSFFKNMDSFEIEDETKYLDFLKNTVFEEINAKKEYKKEPKKEETIQTFSATYKSLHELLGPVYTTYLHERSNKSLHYRFLDSLFHILYNDFWRKKEHEKHNFFIQWTKKINTDFSEKELYYHFNYSKNRKMKRENIIKVLNQVLIEKCDYEIFHTYIQYCFDVLNMSGIILHIKNGNIDFEKSEIYHYKNIYNPLNPLGIIYYDNGVYYPVLRNDKSISIFNMCDEDDYEIVNTLYKYMKQKPIDSFLKDLENTSLHSPMSHSSILNIMENENIEEKIQTKAVEEKVQIKVEEKIVEEKVIEQVVEEKVIKKKKYNMYNLDKMKIDDIRTLCETHNISIKKKSEKTNKDINKLKGELITDLLEINE